MVVYIPIVESVTFDEFDSNSAQLRGVFTTREEAEKQPHDEILEVEVDSPNERHFIS